MSTGYQLKEQDNLSRTPAGACLFTSFMREVATSAMNKI